MARSCQGVTESTTELAAEKHGKGRFTDVADQAAPGLSSVGMVTDALWRDVYGNGRSDLVVVGEWMPITIFRNMGGGRLEKMNVPGLEKSDGWWNRIIAGDFTGDGRVDFIVGKSRTQYAAARERKRASHDVRKDFANNGLSADHLVLQPRSRVSAHPARRSHHVPSRSSRTATSITLTTLTRQWRRVPAKGSQRRVVRNAYTFATFAVRNNGDGTFTLVPLRSRHRLPRFTGFTLRLRLETESRTCSSPETLMGSSRRSAR